MKRKIVSIKDSRIPYHPCIHPEANGTVARIHLPVARTCNLTCRYCARRYLNHRAGLPGTSSRIMDPERAIRHLQDQRKIWGKHSVVGIAGPGEPLANSETFEVLTRIRERFPSHPLCLCTNGLLLKDNMDSLVRLGIRVISMTINGTDPGVVQQLQPGLKVGGLVRMGTRAAEYLIQSQLEGLRRAVAAGMFVKVNTVVAEGVNDVHITELARVLGRAGAGIMNIIPVIAPHKQSRLSPPDRGAIHRLRDACETHLPQFRLCRQCRADAAGIPGRNSKGVCGS